MRLIIPFVITRTDFFRLIPDAHASKTATPNPKPQTPSPNSQPQAPNPKPQGRCMRWIGGWCSGTGGARTAARR